MIAKTRASSSGDAPEQPSAREARFAVEDLIGFRSGALIASKGQYSRPKWQSLVTDAFATLALWKRVRSQASARSNRRFPVAQAKFCCDQSYAAAPVIAT